MIALSPEQMVEVQSILKDHVPTHQVWAFGSRITPLYRPHSDLDLAIISTDVTPLETLSKLRAAFEESSLPFTVDLVDWKRLSPEFQSLIEKHHEVLGFKPGT